eukprot:CAMPEP_0184686328 /NCGR_PEP_ID=MMETSP0312-20130426/22048_1 /TAXON_ID=31354 /ORGANISM="Compsopogon coeruleus, Strain SAG 36.94" /LENGTH=30 /DNA_ID= /DNA_START= /DNA_END= /DNA_ORIENTATION=
MEIRHNTGSDIADTKGQNGVEQSTIENYSF